MIDIDTLLDRLEWLGHDTFLYTGEAVVYFNPFELRKIEVADLILIGHDHFHHCSLPDIKKIWREGTAIVCDRSAARKLEPEFPVISLAPGERLEVKGLPVEAVPAYNLATSFHPKKAGHLGFIVTLEGARVYHAGDTDFIPEMRDLEVDVALLPVCGLHMMTAAAAAQAALALRPKVAIPTHYGTLYGSQADAESFRALLSGQIRVNVLAKS